jgi:transcriptional regulator with XRE-family HTH domain
MSITPTESRTARALLDWTLTDLAKASLLGVSTIKNFETERHETTLANLAAIRGVFEKAGVIFESDGKFVGVKLKIKRGK